MNSSDSLHLDEHLARLLAAYDQGLGDGDAKAPTLDVPAVRVPGERVVGPMSAGAVNQGSAADALPDAAPPRAYLPAAPPSATPETHRIGRFELRKQLGKGGCGIVFLAYDPTLKREVALKIPRPELLLSPDARRRLIREAHAAAEFNHPNLVPVYETGEIGPVCYIATAFCPGQTLSDWLDRQSFPVPVRQAARLVAQLAEAVQHAHDRGVLHRDLKPNNVILQETRIDPNDQGPSPGACPLRGDLFVPRVVDFGLAKLAESGPGETVTRQVLGTPKYMAPEQAQGRHEDVGPQADVYALGVILYELLAGRPPYDAPTDVEVLRLAVEGNFTPPRDDRPDLPRDLEAICLKAMDRVPIRRYRTAIDLADDLRRFLDGLPTVARPLNRLGRSARWLRRNDQAVALGVVTTVAFILLTFGVWSVYEARKLRDAQTETQARDAERMRTDRQWAYARHVRDAFLSWRAGDARQMTESLGDAFRVADTTDFPWGYLSQLGRVERLSAACPAGPAVALAVAPGADWAVTGHADGTLAVWDRQTGAVKGAVKAHPAEVTHVAFLDKGSRVVTAGGEAVVRVWVIDPNGRPTAGPVVPLSGAAVTALDVAPGGSRLYAGSVTGECVVWDLTANRAVRTWSATGDQPVSALTVSPDGRTVATAARGEGVQLWDAAGGGSIGQVRGAAGTTALAFTPAPRGGWLLAAAGEDGTVRLFDPDGREVRSLPGHAGPVRALAASPDGLVLASGGTDDGVAVWDVPTGSMRALLRGHDRPARGLGFTPDGKALVTAAEDGLLKVWDLTADPEGHVVRGLPADVAQVAVHPDEQRFAVAFADGSVAVYPHRGGPPRRFPAGGRGPLRVLRFPESGPPYGVELTGRAATVWEFAAEPRAVFRADLPADSTATVADLSVAAGLLAVGTDRGALELWSFFGHGPRHRIETGLTTPVRHLALSDDGKWVVTETGGQVLGVWEVGDPAVRQTVPGHGDGTWQVRFLVGHNRVVTAGRGSSIKVWNVVSGKEELSLLGHVGRVTALAVSADGRTLVSGSGTGEVKLWDLRTGMELIGLRRHTGAVTTAEFGRTGRVLITGGRGELAFWDTPKE